MLLNYHQIRGKRQIDLSTCTQKHTSTMSELFWSSKMFYRSYNTGRGESKLTVRKQTRLLDTEVGNDGRRGVGKGGEKTSGLELSICSAILSCKIEERGNVSFSDNKNDWEGYFTIQGSPVKHMYTHTHIYACPYMWIQMYPFLYCIDEHNISK